jgi:cytochrome P450
MHVANLLNPINSTDQSFLDNPYPMLERLRNEAPVFWSRKDKCWIVSRYAEASLILRDPDFGAQIQTWRYAPNPFWLELIPHINAASQSKPIHAAVKNITGSLPTPTET